MKPRAFPNLPTNDPMFNPFKRQKPSHPRLIFPAPDWPVSRDTPELIQWTNPDQTMAVSIHSFHLKPNIPSLKSLDTCRKFYQTALEPQNGSLISLDICLTAGVKSLKSLVKIPQSPSGFLYIASLTIPFATCSFVCKVEAIEWPTTGIREAVIANQLLAKGTPMSEFAVQFDDPAYDAQFPDHPLSQSRKWLERFQQQVEFTEEVNGLKPFE